MEAFKHEDLFFIVNCELGQNDTIHLLYERDNLRLVNGLLENDLIALAKETFSEQVVDKIFFRAEYKVIGGNRKFTSHEVSYADKLKRKYVEDDEGNHTFENSGIQHALFFVCRKIKAVQHTSKHTTLNEIYVRERKNL